MNSSFLLVTAVAVAASLAALATPLARRVAYRFDFVDHPSPRKVHRTPTPLLGGAAIYCGFMVTTLAVGSREHLGEAAGILLGATLVAMIGGVDDRVPVGPAGKLLVQLLALALLVAGGVQVHLLGVAWLDLALTALWVLGITNAINLLDNMDGLAAGVVAIGGSAFLLLAAMVGQQQVAVLAAALVGSCAGFLLYNTSPASIFMGDSGSLFLGFVLACLGLELRFLGEPRSVTWMVPVVALGLPIFDTTLVVVSRLRRGRNPFTAAGVDHLSHRIARRLASPRRAVWLCYGLAALLGFVALLLSRVSPATAWMLATGLAVAALVSLVYLETAP